jgi:hypothetical protein
MYRALFALALIVTALPASATEPLPGWNDAQAETATMLSCGTGEESEGYLAMRGEVIADETRLRTLQFVENDKGTDLAPWPSEGTMGPEKFFYSNSFGPEGAFSDIRFQRDGQTWHLYSFTGPWRGDEPQDGAGGLAVVDSTGKLVRDVGCSERIMIYYDVLEATATCDTHGPLGEAACTGAEVHRTETLAELYPWFAAAAPGALIPSTD